MSNPFDVLGNDFEESGSRAPREVVKKSTSSKKTDAAPPSANPNRANKNRPKPTGNEAAFKDGKAGRAANQAKGVEEQKAPRKPVKGGKTDRQSRTGKSDTQKRVKQAGWTADGETELESELEGAQDAAEELEEDAEDKPVKKSLDDYLKEREASATIGSQREIRKVESTGDEEVIAKEQESFIAPSKSKNLKQKALKTKNILEFDATFSDDLPKPAPTRGGRGNARGPRGATRGRGPRGNSTRGPRGGKAPRASSGPSINDEANFPSLA